MIERYKKIIRAAALGAILALALPLAALPLDDAVHQYLIKLKQETKR